MKFTTFVALLLLSLQCFAENLDDSLERIESQWATVYYNTPKPKRGSEYNRLLTKIYNLSKQFPNNAEPLIWEAIVKASNADHQDPLSALKSIREAHDLLLKAIKINPQAMSGSAYVTLGTLYSMAPKWPISFGDKTAAKKMLETALKINPKGIDSNYFYGEFLLADDKSNEAQEYFKRAVTIPSRPRQLFADDQLKKDAMRALMKSKNQISPNLTGLFASLQH
jgi:tetratricopeptide (TPR) repeat protein